MELSQITLLIFTVFGSIRVVSYIPQIARVAADRNGASAISYSTWSMWVAANAATGLYAVVNLHDNYLAAMSFAAAACCLIVIVLTAVKRRALPRTLAKPAGNCRGRLAPPLRSLATR